MIIQRLGHAALLVELAGRRILIDPGTYAVPEAFEQTGLDAIVVTHQHPDHADPERLPGLVRLNPDARLLMEGQAIAKLSTAADAWTETRPGETVSVGRASVTGVGGSHAIIHPELPRVGNVGVNISAPGEPSLFHPGDAYDAAPDEVGVLAVPVSAPWAKLSETVEFVRRVGASVVLPIHDAALTDVGYPIYWRTIEQLSRAARCERLEPTGRITVD